MVFKDKLPVSYLPPLSVVYQNY